MENYFSAEIRLSPYHRTSTIFPTGFQKSWGPVAPVCLPFSPFWTGMTTAVILAMSQHRMLGANASVSLEVLQLESYHIQRASLRSYTAWALFASRSNWDDEILDFIMSSCILWNLYTMCRCVPFLIPKMVCFHEPLSFWINLVRGLSFPRNNFWRCWFYYFLFHKFLP